MPNPLIICPGFHDPAWTKQWLARMNLQSESVCCCPADYPVYSPAAVLALLQAQCDFTQPIRVIAYSAGNLGGLGAAVQWQKLGGRVAGLIAIDPWGVPLVANFPMVTVSHDIWTDCYSQAWGISTRFVAHPPVSHLQLWQSPQSAWGLGIRGGLATRQTAKTFIHQAMQQFINV